MEEAAPSVHEVVRLPESGHVSLLARVDDTLVVRINALPAVRADRESAALRHAFQGSDRPGSPDGDGASGVSSHRSTLPAVTIAISLKVDDGLVLAADSASTIVGLSEEGVPTNVINVYNHANKIANLRKGSPIGVVTWGSGSIGAASISTLLKDLRKRFTDEGEWHLDPENYTVEHVAERLREFMFEEKYRAEYGEIEPERWPPLGFVVGGYSSEAERAERADEFQVMIANGECPPPERLREYEDAGVTWNGEPEAITRLLLGFGNDLPAVLQQRLGVPDEQVQPVMEVVRQGVERHVVFSAMPIQDAIDLARFLVEVTIGFSRFTPGASTVGGEIEIAAITKHEGFKWVRRKHYFTTEFNPEGMVP